MDVLKSDRLRWAWYVALLVPFYINDFFFIASESALEWLAMDYATRVITLGVICFVPEFRAYVRSSFGALRKSGEPLPMAFIRIGLLTWLAIFVTIMIDLTGNRIFAGIDDPTVLFRYPKIDSAPVLAFELTFGLALVAVSEEFASRAIILQALMRGGRGRALALCISSTLFAVAHWSQGVVNLAFVGLFGIVAGLLFLSTRSIVPPILAHYAYNLWFFYFYYYG